MAQSAYSLAVSQGASPAQAARLQGAPGTQGGGDPWRYGGTFGGLISGPPGTYTPPPPPGGGGYAPPPPRPNPGDFNELGMRWEPNSGQFLPPNFFQDLTYGYSEFGGPGTWYDKETGVNRTNESAPYYGYEGVAGGYGYGGGGGGGGGVPAAPHVTPPPVVAPPGGITPMTPGQFPYLYLPENLAGAIPEQYRANFGQVTNDWLRGLGYTGLGDVGRYGERKYNPPPGAASPYYLAPSLFGAIADPNMRSWLNYVLGEYGLTTRIPMPAVTPPA